MAKNINFLNNNTVGNINTNFQRVNDALEDVLTRSGELPNNMEADIDLNNNDLLNVNTLQATTLTVGGVDLSQRITDAEAAADEAEAIYNDILRMNAVRQIVSDKVITVGTGGDVSTINEALKVASRIRSDYKKEGILVEVCLLSGFVMAEQVFVYQKDMSFVTITAEDAEVTIQRSALVDIPVVSNWRTGVFPAFTAMRGAGLPTIRALFSMDDSGTGYGTVGVLIKENSHGTVERGFGIKNAGWRGLYVDNGLVYARQTVWDGAGLADGVAIGAGIRISNGAIGNVRDSSAKDCANGLYANEATVMAMNCDFSGAVLDGGLTGISGNGVIISNSSVVHASGNDCSRAGRYAALVQNNATLTLTSSDLSNAGDHALQATNSVVVADGSDLSGATNRGVNASAGSRVSVINADITGCDISIVANSSEVIATGADCRGATASNSIRTYGGATVRFQNGRATSVGGPQLLVSQGSIIQATGATDGAGSSVKGTIPDNTTTSDGLIIGDDGLVQINDVNNVTLTDASPEIQVFNTPLIGSRSITLPDASVNRTFLIVRTIDATDDVNSEMTINVAQSGVGIFYTLNPGQWVRVAPIGATWTVVEGGSLTKSDPVSSDRGDESLRLTSLSEHTQLFNTPLSQSRTLNLPSPSLKRSYRIVRTAAATGAFNLSINYSGVPIETLAVGEWCDVAPSKDGTTYVVTARGSL